MENFDISLSFVLRGAALKELKKLKDLSQKISSTPIVMKPTLDYKGVIKQATNLRAKLLQILSPLTIKTKLDSPPKGTQIGSSIRDRTSLLSRETRNLRNVQSRASSRRWNAYEPSARGVPFMNRRMPVREVEDLLYHPTYTIAAMYGAVSLYPIKLASEYEDALLQLDKAWQRIGDTSSASLKNMRDQLMDIKGISGKDAIALATEVAKQGVSDAKAITNLVKELAVSTEALEIPAQTAASYIAKILDINTLQMTKDNVRQVTDLLAHLSNTMSGVKPPDLVEVWKRSSKALAHLNMGLEEQAALSAAVLQTGISKYFSGSEIKKFTRRLASPVLNKDRKSLQELGLDKSGLQMLNMIREEGAQGLIKVIQMFNKLSDVQREKALGMAGKQLIESMRGEKQLDKLRKALDLAANSAGASSEEFKKYSKTFTAKMREVWDAIHSFLLAMGDPLLDMLKPIATAIGWLGSKFRGLNASLGEFSAIIFGSLGVLVAVKALNKVFTLLFPALLPRLAELKNSIMSTSFSLSGVGQSIKSSGSFIKKAISSLGVAGWSAIAFGLIQLADAILPLEDILAQASNWFMSFYLKGVAMLTGVGTVEAARNKALKDFDIYRTELSAKKSGITATRKRAINSISAEMNLKDGRYETYNDKIAEAASNSATSQIIKMLIEIDKAKLRSKGIEPGSLSVKEAKTRADRIKERATALSKSVFHTIQEEDKITTSGFMSGTGMGGPLVNKHVFQGKKFDDIMSGLGKDLVDWKNRIDKNTEEERNNTNALKSATETFIKLSVFIGTDEERAKASKQVRAYDPIVLSPSNPKVTLD